MKAFPRHPHVGNLEDEKMGMDLRDYFAAQALNDACRRFGSAYTAAVRAYEVADHMLKVREMENPVAPKS